MVGARRLLVCTVGCLPLILAAALPVAAASQGVVVLDSPAPLASRGGLGDECEVKPYDGSFEAAIGFEPEVRSADIVQAFEVPDLEGVPFVDDVCVWGTTDGTPTETAFDVVVFDDSGTGGGPGILLGSAPATPLVPSFPGVVACTQDFAVNLDGVTTAYLGISFNPSQSRLFVATDRTGTTPARDVLVRTDLGGVFAPATGADPAIRAAGIGATFFESNTRWLDFVPVLPGTYLEATAAETHNGRRVSGMALGTSGPELSDRFVRLFSFDVMEPSDIHVQDVEPPFGAEIFFSLTDPVPLDWPLAREALDVRGRGRKRERPRWAFGVNNGFWPTAAVIEETDDGISLLQWAFSTEKQVVEGNLYRGGNQVFWSFFAVDRTIARGELVFDVDARGPEGVDGTYRFNTGLPIEYDRTVVGAADGGPKFTEDYDPETEQSVRFFGLSDADTFGWDLYAQAAEGPTELIDVDFFFEKFALDMGLECSEDGGDGLCIQCSVEPDGDVACRFFDVFFDGEKTIPKLIDECIFPGLQFDDCKLEFDDGDEHAPDEFREIAIKDLGPGRCAIIRGKGVSVVNLRLQEGPFGLPLPIVTIEEVPLEGPNGKQLQSSPISEVKDRQEEGSHGVPPPWGILGQGKTPTEESPRQRMASDARRLEEEGFPISARPTEALHLATLFERRPCVPSARVLCLNDDRFQVTVDWVTPRGEAGVGRTLSLTDDSGLFHFFAPDNLELVVKVLDACGLADFESFWVFAAGLTDVEVTIEVVDILTGARQLYFNPGGTPFQPILDTAAFATCLLPRRTGRGSAKISPPSRTGELAEAAGSQQLGAVPVAGGMPTDLASLSRISDLPPWARQALAAGEADAERARTAVPRGGGCVSGPTTLCLNEGRFEVTAQWTTRSRDTGPGQAIELTADTGALWFFNPDNVEVLVKVLDACESPFNSFWVFAAGLTDVEVELTVTDTETGVQRQYTSALGAPFEPIQDTSAFATCP